MVKDLLAVIRLIDGTREILQSTPRCNISYYLIVLTPAQALILLQLWLFSDIILVALQIYYSKQTHAINLMLFVSLKAAQLQDVIHTCNKPVHSYMPPMVLFKCRFTCACKQ